MKNFPKRISVFCLTILLLVLPVTNVFRLPVKAANIWEPLTDSDFAENNSIIFQLIGFGGGVIWGTQNKVFMTGGGGATDISGQIFDNDAHLINLAFSGAFLFALTLDDSGNYKFWTSPSAGEWNDSSSIFGDIPNFLGASYMGIFSNLLTFEILTDDEGDTLTTIYILAGEALQPITDNLTFAGASIPAAYLSVIKVIDYGDGQAMFLIKNLQNNTYYLYNLNGETLELFHSFGSNEIVTDIASFAGSVYAYIYVDEDHPVIKFYNVEGNGTVVTDLLLDQEYTGLFTVADDLLIVGTSTYTSDYARVFSIDSENNFVLVVDHVGDISPDPSLNNTYITGLTSFDSIIIAAAGFPGEGPYHPSVWIYGDLGDDPLPDSDSDGIDSDVEVAAPNDGDSNNDGTPDDNQNNVASFVNPVTATYSTLDSGECGIESVTVNQESVNVSLDSGFSYPVGMMNFHLVCVFNADPKAPTITQYFYGDYNPELFVLRKYNTNTHTYVTVNAATITRVTIGGLPALKVSYVVEDGGPLDMDGTVNNEITDPSGPALNSVLAPNTGLGGSHLINKI